MAVERVFGIGELRDNILRHLDERTLLLSQNVNRAFASSIAESSEFQRQLFFVAEEPSPSASFGEITGTIYAMDVNHSPEPILIVDSQPTHWEAPDKRSPERSLEQCYLRRNDGIHPGRVEQQIPRATERRQQDIPFEAHFRQLAENVLGQACETHGGDFLLRGLGTGRLVCKPKFYDRLVP